MNVKAFSLNNDNQTVNKLSSGYKSPCDSELESLIDERVFKPQFESN